MTNLVSSGFASVPNASLYYEVAGEGTPVVLIPGYTLDTRSGMISSQPLRKVISWFATTARDWAVAATNRALHLF